MEHDTRTDLAQLEVHSKNKYMNLSMHSYSHHKNFNAQTLQHKHIKMESYKKELARKC